MTYHVGHYPELVALLDQPRQTVNAMPDPVQVWTAPEWHQRAACKGLTTAEKDRWFFPRRGEDLSNARRVCATCPVKAECLDHALTQPEAFGVWAGTSERERRAMRRERRGAA